MPDHSTCIGCGRRIAPEFDACESCVMGPYVDAAAIDRDLVYDYLHSDQLGPVTIPEDDPQ